MPEPQSESQSTNSLVMPAVVSLLNDQSRGYLAIELKFLTEIAASLAWPLTLLIIFFVLRSSIKNLLRVLTDRIRTGKAVSITKDGLIISGLLADLKEEASSVLESGQTEQKLKEILYGGSNFQFTQQLRNSESNDEEVMKIGELMNAWKRLERSARNALEKKGIKEGADSFHYRFRAELRKTNLLDEGEFRIFEELRRLRNIAAHSDVIELPPSAHQYKTLANDLSNRLDARTSSI